MNLRERNDAILDRWSKNDAVRSIRMELGVPSIKAVHRVIEKARAMHDPRAVYRFGRESSGRPPIGKRKDRPARRRLTTEKATLDGWWFARETVYVTRLGFGSADCLRVPVSVSCLPETVPLAPIKPATCVVSVCRSLAEAMAKHALAGIVEPAGVLRRS
jgi:hypothetical protein